MLQLLVRDGFIDAKIRKILQIKEKFAIFLSRYAMKNVVV